MLTAPPLVEAKGFSVPESIEFVDLDLGLPMGEVCCKLSACDGIPLIPPPMGPALARSKVIGGIPDELHDKPREDEDAMWENIRFATSDFELRALCRPGPDTPAPSLIAGLGTDRPIRLSPSEFEWEYNETPEVSVFVAGSRFGTVLEGSGWEQLPLQLDVSAVSCVPVTFSML